MTTDDICQNVFKQCKHEKFSDLLLLSSQNYCGRRQDKILLSLVSIASELDSCSVVEKTSIMLMMMLHTVDRPLPTKSYRDR